MSILTEEKAETVKCVTVGDGAIGKTAMLISYTQNQFPQDYIPTVFENYSQTFLVGGKNVVLNLWDTAGQEEYKTLRTLSYPSTSVFLVCFSVVTPSSFENLREHWIPELKYYCPSTPYLIIGLKSDLRTDKETLDNLQEKKQKVITQEEAKQLAKDLKAVNYLECSSLTRVGLEEIFHEAIYIATRPPKRKFIRCTLL